MKSEHIALTVFIICTAASCFLLYIGENTGLYGIGAFLSFLGMIDWDTEQ